MDQAKANERKDAIDKNSYQATGTAEENNKMTSSQLWQVIVASDNDHHEDRAVSKGPVLAVRGREVLLAIAVFFLLTLAIGLIACLTASRSKDDMNLHWNNCHDQHSNDSLSLQQVLGRFCMTRECLQTAAEMLTMMDQTADYCNDFYQYACGGWLNNNEVPFYKGSWGVDSILESRVQDQLIQLLEGNANVLQMSAESKAKLLYDKCINTDNIDSDKNAPLTSVLQQLGGWAIVDKWNPSSLEEWDFIATLSSLHSRYDVDVLFKGWIGPDDRNTQHDILQLDQGGLGLPSADMYLTIDETDAILPAYRKLLTTVAQLYGSSKDLANEFAAEVIHFEKNLAEIFISEDSMERRDPTEIYNRLSLSEMNELCPAINWTRFVRGFLLLAGENTELLITSRNYFSNLSKIIRQSQDRTLNYYFMWRLVQTYLQALPLPYRKAINEFEIVLKGFTNTNRKKHCLSVVESHFPLVMSSMFIDRYFPLTNKDAVTQIVRDIRRSFQHTLNNTPWLDEQTKPQALVKLDRMQMLIGYPESLLDSGQQNKIYYDTFLNESSSYLTVLLSLVKASKQRTYDMFNAVQNTQTTSSESEWLVKPHEVNAAYSILENSLIIPAGILQPPFYSANLPRYMNYGRIGSIIGHEMIHGFDIEGSSYGANGSLHSWWSVESHDDFLRRSQCIIDHFSSLEVDGLKINGERTVGENMADIAGLAQAYKTYKRLEKEAGNDPMLPGLNLSNDQTFFLAYAQNWCKKRRRQNLENYIANDRHSPEKIRVQGVLMQLPPFATTFNCKEGSKLKLRKSKKPCQVW